MKLKEAKIYGFGKWVDYTIDFSNDSFVCVYGENESGKSTLQRFILFILFGLPPKQRNFYVPKTSSKMGGRLTIVDTEIGEYVVERVDGTRNGAAICYTPDGLEHDEKWLKKRLNGMSASIYESIYSFDAADLSAIQMMKQDDVGEVLLGIGLTGSTHIHTVEKQLDTKIGELFKPYGTKPKVNVHLKKLDELAKDIQQYKQEESTYVEKTENLATLKNEKERLQTKLRVKKESILHLEKKLQAIPYLHELNSNSEQMENLPSDKSFPENGISRLSSLNEKVLPLQSEMVVLKQDEEKYLNEKNQIESELISDSADGKAAQKLLEQKQQFLNQKHQLSKLNEEIKQHDLKIKNQLNHINIGLTNERIETLQLPFHIEKKWNDLKNNQVKLDMELEQLAEEDQEMKSKQAYLQEELNKCKENRLSIKERAKFEERLKNYHETALLTKLGQDTKKKKRTWKKKQATVEKRSQIVLLTSFVLMAIFLITHFIMNLNNLINFAILTFVIGIIYWSRGRILIKNIDELIRETNDGLKSLSSTEEEIQEANYFITKDDDLKNSERLLNDQLRNIDIQLLQLHEKKESWNYKKNRLQEQIEEQYQLYPFLKEVEITFWPELFHTLKNLLVLQHDKEDMESEAASLTEKQNQFSRKVSRLITETDGKNQSIEQQFYFVQQKVNDMRDKQTRLSQLSDLIDENKVRQQHLLENINTYQNKMKQLFCMANVSDEESFYKKANELDQLEQLQTSINNINVQFLSIFTNEEWNDLIHSIPRESELEMDIQKNKTDVEKIENKIENIRQQIADLHADLIRMETSEDYSRAMYQFDLEKNKLNDMARKWAVLKTAKETVNETKRRYRNKYLNRVIDRTTVYFKELTGNQYIQVYIPEKDMPFFVEAADHIRYTLNELSQGTINQLYVSLRLAISEVMNEEKHFPFIIDDAFVHFDSVRTSKILNILQKQSPHQQIILFTCKQEILDCFNSGNVIELKKMVSSV